MNLFSQKNFFFRTFQISSEEIKFTRRGFRISQPAKVERLETIGKKFLYGYNTAITTSNINELSEKLHFVESFYQGFAFEGAAMGVALLDNLFLRHKNLLPEFLTGVANPHIYTAYVGIGWALARLPWFRYRAIPNLSKFDSLLKWLIIDGFGFHEGYFYPRKYFQSKIFPIKLKGYARNAFVQGLGRSLWFIEGADVEKIPETIMRLPENFHADLWSGIGLACSYAGEADAEEIEKLKNSSGVNLSNLAQGAAFAARARQRAGNPSEQTDLACRMFCLCTSTEAALITDRKLENLSSDAEIPAYEIWRQRIAREFS